jgi:ubiquinone/menaquinone biosynthesis C-methylase UbiE
MRRLARARELLDGPLDDPAALEGNLRDLARINRLLGGTDLSDRALDALSGEPAREGRTIALLDVGTGGADIPISLAERWSRRGRRLEVVAVEDRAQLVDAAGRITPDLARHRVRLLVADGRALPWPDGAFDVAHCSLVLHHLDPPGAVAMLREMARVSTRGVIVNDLTRGRWLWLGARLLARLATRNRYTRHDAPLSVRRAWTLKEARAMLAVAGLRPVAEFSGPFGHRWAIAARP